MLESNRDEADWEPLERWYTDHVRPLLERLDATRATEIETDLERLRQTHERLNDELCTCFLGSSGIGKSTLINALVAGHEEIVPAGGVGPLTAQALTVRYADAGSFEAKYHDAGKLNQLRFVLEGGLRAKAAQPDGVAASPDDSLGLPFDEADELRSEVSNEDDESGSRAEKFRKQARLLVTGDQNSSDGDSDTPYLVDGLRQALGQDSLFNSELTADDAARVKRLRELLIRDGNQWPSRTFTLHEGDSHFRARLAEHATGFLSPMIESLNVQWKSELLAHGVALVDLPGLGIAGDVYRDVTQKYVKERAKAIVLVVGNRGITESDAQLLHASGFLNRLLHSAYDTSADMASLIIAVTRIDDIADDQRTKDKTKTKREHFAIAQEQSRQHVLKQIRSKLEEAWSLAGEAVSGIKRQVIETVVDRMSIFPVSAPQYRKCLAQDEDDPAFIQLPAASGIPDMVAGLRARAELERDDRWRCYVEARNLLIERLLSTLRVIQHQWQEDSRAEDESERLLKQLLHFLQPLREEFRVRQGAFREFLKATLPQRIKTLVTDAKLTTQKSIRTYVKSLGEAHVRTLQAAVSRGGTFRGGRDIDLPTDFALTFEEPIAEVWGTTVLREIRQRTGDFANDCVELVDKLIEQVIGWATENGVLVNEASISGQREAIRLDSQKLKAIGSSAVGGLREKVKNQLTQAIEPTIRRRCRSFVDAQLNKRSGVRIRILVMFDELVTDAVDLAAPHAEAILLGCYREMEDEMRRAFFEAHADPLQEAADAIIESREKRERRSDATERVAVLSQIELALLSSPPLTIATGITDSGVKL
ncbi:MAG: dynamin family protein [Planctomycetaceae bacterium]|nr:dynamin family protein [Planctomycetaceae bacterium]